MHKHRKIWNTDGFNYHIARALYRKERIERPDIKRCADSHAAGWEAQKHLKQVAASNSPLYHSCEKLPLPSCQALFISFHPFMSPCLCVKQASSKLGTFLGQCDLNLNCSPVNSISSSAAPSHDITHAWPSAKIHNPCTARDCTALHSCLP